MKMSKLDKLMRVIVFTAVIGILCAPVVPSVGVTLGATNHTVAYADHSNTAVQLGNGSDEEAEDEMSTAFLGKIWALIKWIASQVMRPIWWVIHNCAFGFWWYECRV